MIGGMYRLLNILVFLWHLSYGQILTSGGLRRFVEIVSRGKKYNIHFTVIENSPAVKTLKDLCEYDVVEFKTILSRYEDMAIIRLVIWIYYTIRAIISGMRLIKKRSFDIVMTFSGELFCTAIPAYIIHLFSRIPLIYVVQLVPPGLPSVGIISDYCRYRSQGFSRIKALGLALYAPIMRIILIKLYNKAQRIIVVSHSLRKQLEQYGVRKEIDVIPNGINVEEIKRITCTEPKIYDAVFVGRHTPEKGIFDLITVWNKVVKVIPTAVLVLVGYCTYDMKKLIDQEIKRYNLTRNIIIKGPVPRKELISIMKRSKFLLFLSREESFALVVGEALACGLPVICYDIPPIREFYRIESVLRCRVGDINDVVNKVLKLLRDDKMRKNLSIKAPIYVQKFKWQESAKKEFQIYFNTVGIKRK